MTASGPFAGRRQIEEHLVEAVRARDALLAVVSAGRRVERRFDAALEGEDVSLAQLRLLLALPRSGGWVDAEPFLQLLSDLCLDERCAGHVEREGWLERDSTGARRITAPGRSLIARVTPLMEEVEDHLSARLGADELTQIVEVLDKIQPDPQPEVRS